MAGTSIRKILILKTIFFVTLCLAAEKTRNRITTQNRNTKLKTETQNQKRKYKIDNKKKKTNNTKQWISQVTKTDTCNQVQC